MTTLIISFDECVIASDSRGTRRGASKHGSTCSNYEDNTTKMWKLGDNLWLMGTGCLNTIHKFMRSYSSLEFPKTKCKTEVALVRLKDGQLEVDRYYTTTERTWSRYLKWDHSYHTGEHGFITLGSGRDYALGALKAGVSIEEAMSVAKKCDRGTGGNTIMINCKLNGDLL